MTVTAQPARHDGADELPLAGLRVVECGDGRLAACGRLLADLGAEVILVEPPGGLATRRAAPLHGDISLAFEADNANKLSVVLDLDSGAGRDGLARLLDRADLVIASLPPARAEALGLDAATLRATRPALVVLAISDFGATGPWRDLIATPAVQAAVSGFLCRSGLPGREPLLPPGTLIEASAAMQAAWVALLAVWQRRRAGIGDSLDFSLREAVAQILDPALGVTGSASAGKSALDSTPHGRPPAMPLYPIIPCADGHVRICVLNPRQWEAMSDWLGPDHAFRDPQYGNIAKRMAVARELNAAIAGLFARFSAAELVAEGQKRGVPIAAVAAPAQVLTDPHFVARRAFVPASLGGATGAMAAGYYDIDGARVGFRDRAPAVGAHTRAVLDALPPAVAAPAVPEPALQRRPLAGLRVLDLGVIVAGAEAGRMFADQGAEVIKVENRAFPDGGRQSMVGTPMSPSIAQGHRNKTSFGVNLRSETGRDLFKQLVARSDVVLSNFKPGTLDSLGLGHDVLSAVNPGIVVMESSALGNSGPRSRSLGYGPLVRAATGLSWLWRYPDDASSFTDGVTIYPDHLAGRVAAIGVLALLLRRERSGRGGTVSLSQAEIFLNANAGHFLRESLVPGSFACTGNRPEFNAPEGVYPCAGDDEWCVVSVRDDADWQRLAAAIGRADLAADPALASVAGRRAGRDRVEAAVAAFTREHAPHDAMRLLQAAGVPAGAMLRLTGFRTDPQFTARNFIRTLEHPGLPAPLPTENAPVRSLHMPDPELRPAPYQGEHTRALAARLLELDADRIDTLIAAGDLEDIAAPAARTA